MLVKTSSSSPSCQWPGNSNSNLPFKASNHTGEIASPRPSDIRAIDPKEDKKTPILVRIESNEPCQQAHSSSIKFLNASSHTKISSKSEHKDEAPTSIETIQRSTTLSKARCCMMLPHRKIHDAKAWPMLYLGDKIWGFFRASRGERGATPRWRLQGSEWFSWTYTSLVPSDRISPSTTPGMGPSWHR
jgi:hypothetical protein